MERISSFLKLGALVGVVATALFSPDAIRLALLACAGSFTVGSFLKGEIKL